MNPEWFCKSIIREYDPSLYPAIYPVAHPKRWDAYHKKRDYREYIRIEQLTTSVESNYHVSYSHSLCFRNGNWGIRISYPIMLKAQVPTLEEVARCYNRFLFDLYQGRN